VRAGGTISLSGNLGGSMAEINLPLVFMKCARMIGVAVGHRDSFEAMVKAMGAANSGAGLKPVIDRKVYRFDELAAALQSLPKGEHFGKVTIDFEP
jgi:NADPH:quinone reductase-like Zn-dependent oxidoreductase